MFSKFFIERPVLACVISIIITLAGAMSLISLPIEQYPSLTPPTVSVSATYTGADAATIATTVATPLEEQINGVDNMIYMETTASAGTMRMTVYFRIGTDPDQATIDVNNRVSNASSKLPEEVKRLGVTVRKASSTTLEALTLVSTDGSMNSTEVYNYIVLNVLDDLKRVPGVGDATAIGNKDYSMRVWLDPDLLNKYQITANEVLSAIDDQNMQYATGKIGEEPVINKSPYVYQITMQGQLRTVEEFENVILRVNSDGSFLRLKDVSEVEIGSKQYVSQGRDTGGDAVPIIINLQSGANSIETARLVSEKMEELSKTFPEGLIYRIPYDTTTFIIDSIKEVVKTFFEALVLVILVMYMFLKNFRSTIIPMIAVPVSIIGTFAGLYALGFSINLLTLFALILAIGIVVDDAIIVVENIDRIIHQNKDISIKDAAIQSMKEMTSPVVSIVLVLCAVFIPVSFNSGFVGEIQKQFALTLAVSVSISGFVALTLTPSLCAMYLRRTHESPFKFVEKFNAFFDWSTEVFVNGVRYVLHRLKLFVILFFIFIVATVFLYTKIPTSLVPVEDQSVFIAITNLQAGSSLNRTVDYIDKMDGVFKQDPVIKDSMAMIGWDILTSSLKENSGVAFVNLKDIKNRKETAFDVTNSYNRKYAYNTEGQTFFINPPPIQGLSITGGFDMYVQNRSGKTYNEIQLDVNELVQAARARPELSNVRTTLDTSYPQYKLEIDRDKLKFYNLTMQDVFTTVASTIGTYYVNDFSMYGKNFQVNVRAKGDFRNTQDALNKIYVKSSDGNMIPLDAILTLSTSSGPDDVKRFNLFPAALVQGDPATGYTSGQAIQAISEVSSEILGSDYTIAWSGTAYQEVTSSSDGQIAFAIGLVFVFLILAAQYERWLMPAAVITAVPFAVLGSLLFTYLRDFSNDVYLQTGLLLLIGLSAKNAILIVEFAMEAHLRDGKSIFDASLEAARLRFRPIVMTSLAFGLGIVPLVVATGAGAASRQSLGTGLLGGIVAASTIAIFFVPLFFYLLETFNKWLDKKKGIINE
ncbi:multidrug efflux RND transporter permease subunit [Campylobacter sp. LR264d]|uniref:efflux RND transporter permease subunit n=1 Tax=Campylobacter sp. LR264d TaxID=2593544 RepID=UPI0012399CEE|nr:multidrug efflux RND transporter permease subunit [Campylobacter sp. LR264d]KAA6233547.1 multidrug efflux RND transporter permease subunit [Campylobacter sp. LR264d]